jgi:hypothetical protein
MTMKTEVIGLCMVLFLLASTSVYAEYEETVHEGIFLVRPDNVYVPERQVPAYLYGEDLTFFACIEYDDVPARLSLLCNADNNFLDVPAVPWGDENCYMGSINLNDFICDDITIAADYVYDGENIRVSKDIHVNKVTGVLQRLLDTQFEDGGWSSSLDTAFALFSLEPFSAVFTDQVNAGLQYLKDTRENEKKCWPEDDCQISTTAMIAYLLTQAGYEDDLRIVHDSTIYLEQNMNFIESGETWNLTLEDFATNINNTVNTSCVLGYDSFDEEVNLSKYGESWTYTFTPEYESQLIVICTENIYADLTSSVRGELIHYEGDNFTYTIPGACWTYNSENVTCDIRTTVFALGAPISDERKQAATEYLDSLIQTDVSGSHFSDDDTMNLALYLVAGDTSVLDSEEKEEVVKHILFRQLNDGSWNVSRPFYNHTFYEPQSLEVANFSHRVNDSYTQSIIYTGFALQSLLSADFDREDEPIGDAERWLSLEETATSLQLTDEQATDAEIVAEYEQNVSDIVNDAKRNGMALFILQQHARPFLTSSPRVIVLDKPNMTIDVVNPTTFLLEDLSYEFSSDLSSAVSIEQKDYFAPYSFRRLTLTQLSNDTEDTFGYLRITSGSEEYAKIPVIVESYPALNIVIPQELTVFGSSTIIPLNITKSAHTFECKVQWKDGGISSVSSITVQNNGLFNLPIQFVQPATEQKDYSGVITCTARSSTFSFPFTLRVNRFLTKPISVQPSVLSIERIGEDAQISVKNLLDESIEVTLSLREPSPYVSFSEDVISMYPGETRNITLSANPPTGENVSLVTAVLIKTFNVEERIPLQVEVTQTAAATTPLWRRILYGVLAAIAATGVGYLIYSYRVALRKWYKKQFRKQAAYDEIMDSVREYEKKEMAIAIKNMIQILKMEGVSEKDIRGRLVEQGFTEEEIQEAIRLKTDEPKSAPTTTPKT